MFTNMAKAGALIGSNATSDLTNFDPSDPAAMAALIAAINGPRAMDGRKGSESLGPNGLGSTTVIPGTGGLTGVQVMAKLHSMGMPTGQPLTVSTWSTSMLNQHAGFVAAINLAKSTGHASDVSKYTNDAANTNEQMRIANLIPVQIHYNLLRDAFLRVAGTTGHPTGATPDQIMAAWKVYSGSLMKLADSKVNGQPVNDTTQAQLKAEATGNETIANMSENVTGMQNGDLTTGTGSTVGKGDTAATQASLAVIDNYDQLMASNVPGQPAMYSWAMGQTTNGVFHAGAGTEMGVDTTANIKNASPAGSVNVFIPQGSGLPPVSIAVQGHPITATVYDSGGTKYASSSGSAPDLGTSYTLPNGQIMYSYMAKDASGTMVPYYGPNPIWGNPGWQSAIKVTTHTDSNGAIAVGFNLPVGFTPTVANGFKATGSASSPGRPTVDETAFVGFADQVRAKAGPNPYTDSTSPSLGALLNSPDAVPAYAALAKDPAFQASETALAHAVAGDTQDPKTGLWVISGGQYVDPGLGANGTGGHTYSSMFAYLQARLNTQGTDINAAVHGIGNLVQAAAGLWGRVSTAPTSTPGTAAWNDQRQGQPGLPADTLRSSGVGFSDLTNIITPGTTKLTNTPTKAGGPTIDTSKINITVPGVSDNGHLFGTPTVAPIKPVAVPTPAPATGQVDTGGTGSVSSGTFGQNLPGNQGWTSH
jgi:hypothetical protein